MSHPLAQGQLLPTERLYHTRRQCHQAAHPIPLTFLPPYTSYLAVVVYFHPEVHGLHQLLLEGLIQHTGGSTRRIALYIIPGEEGEGQRCRREVTAQ
jgi:hypothetical protein